MNRLTKKIATALIGLGSIAGAVSEVQACPGGGGGGRGYGGYRPAYHPQPRYAQPAPQPYYHQPAYQQPSYGPPVGGSYAEPGFSQPNPQFAGPQSSGPIPNQLPPTVKKMATARPSAAVRPQLPQGGQSVSPLQIAATGGRQFASQPIGQAAGSQTAASPLQSLGGGPVLRQPQGDQQQFAGEQGGPSQQVAPRQQIARRPQTQPTEQPTQQPQSQPSSPMDSAQLSALEALGGFESDEPQQLEAQAQPQDQAESFEEPQPVQASRTTGRPQAQPMHVGNWTAALQNGSKVELTLQADGSFSWVATSGDKVSSFEGSYTVSGGSLTLVRSSDNQKLAGSMTPAGSSGFTFKLTGSKDAGLTFSRG